MKNSVFTYVFLLLATILFLGSIGVKKTLSVTEVLSLDSNQQVKKTCMMLRSQKNEAFKRGEKLTYRMHYGFINAGEVSMTVLDENFQMGGRNTLHVVGLGNTNSSFD